MEIVPPEPATVTGITAAISVIAAMVVAGTQLTKRLLPGDEWGPYVGLLWSVFGVVLWLYSQPVWPPARESAFAIGSATVVVWGYASGIYAIAKLSGEQVKGLSSLRRRRERAVGPERDLPPERREAAA